MSDQPKDATETGSQGPLTNAANTILDGLNQITGPLYITRDPNATPAPDTGIGKKALGAVAGVVGVAYKPADIVRQVGGNLLYDLGQDVGVVPKLPDQEPPKSGSHALDTLGNIGHNIVHAPIDVTKGVATGACTVVSGVVDLVTAPFGEDEPEVKREAEQEAVLPEPRDPNRAGLKKMAAETEIPAGDATLQNSRGAPQGIIPVGVRAALHPVVAPRFHAPGGPG